MRWDKPEKAKEIVDRCNYITGVLLNEYHLKDADAVVAPAVKHIHWIEFDQIDFLVNEGARAMKESLLEIRAKIGLKTFLDKVRDLFSWKGSREQVAGTRDDDQPQNQPPAGLN
jgi:hypothetical protein